MRLHTHTSRRRRAWSRRRLLAMLVVAGLAWHTTAHAQSPAPPPADDALWGGIVLPGGVAAARDAAAIGPANGRLDAMFLIDVARRHANSGIDIVAARLDAHLRASTAADDSARATFLPLPLPAFWRDHVFTAGRHDVASIAASRGNLLLYHGLMAADHGALEALAARPGLLDWIRRTPTAAAAFATAARGIRVTGDRVEVPGGDMAVAVWADLAGRQPADVDRFLRALLTTDSGRLAWFYDTVAGLSADRQRFVLGAHLPDTSRRAFVRAVYRAFAGVEPAWRIDLRPFHRPAFDGTLALLALDVHADGTAGPDWWPALFSRITGTPTWPSEPGQTMRDLPARPADARWFFTWVFADRDAARQRFETLRFAQRLFGATPRDAAPDVEIVLRGVMEMPALLFSLERMGVSDPARLARLARAARAATDRDAGDGNLAAIARWQAALGLLEQAQRRAALPSDRLADLLESWAAAAPRGGESPGTVAGWLADALVPALTADVEPGADADETLLDGATRARRPAVAFDWEGLAYQIDPSSAARRSAIAIRTARTNIRLDDLLAIRSGSLALDAAREAPGDPRPAAGQLRTAIRAIAALPGSTEIGARRLDQIETALIRIGTSTIGDARRRAADVRRDLLELVDAVTDVVVPSLLYALAVSPTSEPILYPELPARHRIRDTSPSTGAARPWQRVAWQPPVDGPAAGTALVGSYLGVDVAMAASQLVRVVSGATPVPQVVDTVDRAGIVESLVVPGAWTTAAATHDIEALAAGRRVVAGWQQQPPARATLAADLARGGVDGWRANAIAWAVHAVGPTALDRLSIGELFWLGASDAGASAIWSGSSRPVDGCLCRVSGRALDTERLRGQHAGVQAFRPLDASLRVAEIVHELGLDLAIVPALLPMALQDWIDRSEPAWVDDADAFATWPPALDAGRVEEYLMELLATGRLTAPTETGEDSP